MNDTPLAKPPTPEPLDDSTEARDSPLWRFNQLYHQVDQHNPHLNGCCPGGAIRQNEFASLPLSLPGLANAVFPSSHCREKTYGKKKNEFASLPRFLRRGGIWLLVASLPSSWPPLAL